MLGGEEGSVCECIVDGKHMDYVLDRKYLGFVLYQSGTNGIECYMIVKSERRV